MVIRDAFFDVNKFGEPMVVEGKEAIFTLLMRLMLLNPGEMEINPEMGVGIVTRWRYCDYDELPELKNTIEDQITSYLPLLAAAEVEVSPSETEDKEVVIEISIDDTLYAFKTDYANNTLNIIKNKN